MLLEHGHNPEVDEELSKELAQLQATGSAPRPTSPNGRRLFEASARHNTRLRSIATGKPQSVTYGDDVAAGNHALGDWSDLTKVLPHESNMGPAGSTDPRDIANASYAESIRNLTRRQGALRTTIADRERLQKSRDRLQEGLKKSLVEAIRRG